MTRLAHLRHVHLKAQGLTTILTVEDFEIYRIGGRKAFRVLPKR